MSENLIFDKFILPSAGYIYIVIVVLICLRWKALSQGSKNLKPDFTKDINKLKIIQKVTVGLPLATGPLAAIFFANHELLNGEVTQIFMLAMQIFIFLFMIYILSNLVIFTKSAWAMVCFAILFVMTIFVRGVLFEVRSYEVVMLMMSLPTAMSVSLTLGQLAVVSELKKVDG